MNKLYEPGEILAKEVERGGILVKRRNGMDTNCATAKGIVATGVATNRNAPNRASADCQPTDGGSAYRNENADGPVPLTGNFENAGVDKSSPFALANSSAVSAPSA
jgi:hypothetical protein